MAKKRSKFWVDVEVAAVIDVRGDYTTLGWGADPSEAPYPLSRQTHREGAICPGVTDWSVCVSQEY